MENKEKTVVTLPPLKTLFEDSFEMFKGSLLNVFILMVISVVIFVVLLVVAVIIAIPLGLLSIFSSIQANALTPTFLASLGGLGVIAGIFIVLSVIISIALQAATILVVANYKHQPEIGKSIRQGFSLVAPLFLASLLYGFIIAGGYFLFIIPGILFQIALYFVSYEIVLNKKGVIASGKRSMGIVFANFWGVLGRVLLLIVVVYAINFIPGIIAGSSGSEMLQGIVSLFTSVLGVLVSFYSMSYAITLYRQAEKATPADKTGKLLWPILAAAIGWIVGIIFTIGILYAVFTVLIPSIQNAAKDKENMKMMQELQRGEQMDPNVILNLLPTGSPERAQLQRELVEMNEDYKMDASDSMMMER